MLDSFFRLSKIFLDPNKHCRKKSLADFMHLEEFRRKLSTTHLSKICRKFSLVSFKMCRKVSVENIGVESFPSKMEKWPVKNFLSKIVMFASQSMDSRNSPKKISQTFITLPKTDYFLSTLHDYRGC